MKYAKAWLLVQSLLLISAMAGVPFTIFHTALAIMCLGYNLAVWRAMVWVRK